MPTVKKIIIGRNNGEEYLYPASSSDIIYHSNKDGTISNVANRLNAVIDPRPNFQQTCSIPVKYVRGMAHNNNYPSSLQSIMFADSDTLIALRVSANNKKAEAVVLKFSEQSTFVENGEKPINMIHRYDLDPDINPEEEISEGTHAGHANGAVFVDNKIYIATGSNGDRGIAVYSYPDFVYQGKCVWEDHIFWSIAYDDKNEVFYLAESGTPYVVYSVPKSVMVVSDSYKEANTLTKAFEYPKFFDEYKPYANYAAFKANSGALSYNNGIFYISAHDPNALVRFRVKNGKTEIIDASQVDNKMGELEHVAFCNGIPYIATQIIFYSTCLNNVYEVSYDHTRAATQSYKNTFNEMAYVTQNYTEEVSGNCTTEIADYSYIFRKGTYRYNYSCIEEAIYYMNEPWAHNITLRSNIRPLELTNINLKITGAMIKDEEDNDVYPYFENLKLNNSNVYFLHTNFLSNSTAPALQIDSCDIVLATEDITFSGGNYDIQGSGDVHTNIPIKASITGLISGKGSLYSTNDRYTTSGIIAVKEDYNQSRNETATVIFDTTRIGKHILFFVGGSQNTKTFMYSVSSLVGSTGKTITRYDTFIRNNGDVCTGTYVITTSYVDETSLSLSVKLTVKINNSDIVIPLSLTAITF